MFKVLSAFIKGFLVVFTAKTAYYTVRDSVRRDR